MVFPVDIAEFAVEYDKWRKNMTVFASAKNEYAHAPPFPLPYDHTCDDQAGKGYTLPFFSPALSYAVKPQRTW